MAKKSETNETAAVSETQAAEANEQENAQAAEAPKGPAKFWINVRKPLGTQEDAKFVSVNGKNWIIKYNTDVLVPEEVYYVLRDAARAENTRDMYIERMTRVE